MKFKVLLTIFVVILVTAIKAQERCPICPQGVCEASCTGEPNVGNNCTTAQRRIMWYFDQNRRICRPMAYLGCGGNNNRWCSKLTCIVRCVLPLG